MRRITGGLRGAMVAALVSVAFLVAGTAAAAGPLRPNDPGFVSYPAPLDQVHAPEAWGVTTGSPSVVIAVIDSGLAPISDLAPAALPGMNFWPGAGGADTADQLGHGTEVASVAAAGINNGIGVAGICGSCRVLPVRVMGPDGIWSSDPLASAINWAAGQPGVRVINLSLWQYASTTVWPPVAAAIAGAVKRGIVVVVIAGNGTNNDTVGSADPAANPLAAQSPEAIRVGGVDTSGQLNTGSNRGSSWVDIAAPYRVPVDTVSGGTMVAPGTSFAAPIVSGVAGLMLSLDPALTPAQVKAKLMASGTAVPGLDVACHCIVNAYAALNATGSVPPQTVRLVVRRTGAGVVSSKQGIACGTRCQTTVPSGTDISLVAKPAAHWRFKVWTGACRGKKPACTVVVSKPLTTVRAVFVKR